MASLPRRLADMRSLFQSLEWDQLSLQIEREAHARLAIVGPVNSGKSSLFNRLKGRKVSPVQAVPGTTQELVSESFGPFTLVDTPGFGEVGGVDRAAIATAAAKEAHLAVLVLAGDITGLGTWAMGRVAISYFESGKRLTPKHLRERYRNLFRRPRRHAKAEQASPAISTITPNKEQVSQ